MRTRGATCFRQYQWFRYGPYLTITVFPAFLRSSDPCKGDLSHRGTTGVEILATLPILSIHWLSVWEQKVAPGWSLLCDYTECDTAVK